MYVRFNANLIISLVSCFWLNKTFKIFWSEITIPNNFASWVWGLGLVINAIQHFSYIVAVSFICEGNRSARWKPLIDFFWCLTLLSAIFQLYHGDQFYWREKPEHPERTTDHRQATGRKSLTCYKSLTTLTHNVVSSIPRMSGVWNHHVSDDMHWLHR